MGESPTLRRAYTACRFGQLHYMEGRPATATATAGPSLILLHQNPSSSEEYRGLALEMSKDRHVIAFDTPGSGMSDWPSHPMPLQDLSGAVSDGLDALGYGKTQSVDVFGYHTGALLAAELARSRPDMVRRIVLSGIPFRSDEERKERLTAARETPLPTPDGAVVLERLAALWRYVVTQRNPRVSIERGAELFMEKAKSMHRFWWPYEGVWSYPIQERFPCIAQPVLVLQPHEELLEQSRRASQLLEHSRFIELPTLSRDVFEVGIVEFAKELRSFLAHETEDAA